MSAIFLTNFYNVKQFNWSVEQDVQYMRNIRTSFVIKSINSKSATKTLQELVYSLFDDKSLKILVYLLTVLICVQSNIEKNAANEEHLQFNYVTHICHNMLWVSI